MEQCGRTGLLCYLKEEESRVSAEHSQCWVVKSPRVLSSPTGQRWGKETKLRSSTSAVSLG